MPNRVDTNINGTRPAMARQGPQQANPPQQAADRTGGAGQAGDAGNRMDRVEISGEAQARAGTQRPAAADAQRDQRRMAAANAPGARPAEAGRQGAAPEAAAERRTQESRQQQYTARQQAAARPPQRPGNLVDVTG